MIEAVHQVGDEESPHPATPVATADEESSDGSTTAPPRHNDDTQRFAARFVMLLWSEASLETTVRLGPAQRSIWLRTTMLAATRIQNTGRSRSASTPLYLTVRFARVALTLRQGRGRASVERNTMQGLRCASSSNAAGARPCPARCVSLSYNAAKCFTLSSKVSTCKSFFQGRNGAWE